MAATPFIPAKYPFYIQWYVWNPFKRASYVHTGNLHCR